jgi:hypothetical protein
MADRQPIDGKQRQVRRQDHSDGNHWEMFAPNSREFSEVELVFVDVAPSNECRTNESIGSRRRSSHLRCS